MDNLCPENSDLCAFPSFEGGKNTKPFPAKGSLSKNLRSNMLLHNQAKHVNIDSCKGAFKDPKQDACSAHAGLKPENISFFQNSPLSLSLSLCKCSGQILCPACFDCLSRTSWITCLLRIATYVLSHASSFSFKNRSPGLVGNIHLWSGFMRRMSTLSWSMRSTRGNMTAGSSGLPHPPSHQHPLSHPSCQIHSSPHMWQSLATCPFFALCFCPGST